MVNLVSRYAKFSHGIGHMYFSDSISFYKKIKTENDVINFESFYFEFEGSAMQKWILAQFLSFGATHALNCEP